MPPKTIPQREPESRYVAAVSLDIRHFSTLTDTQRTRAATEFRDAVEAGFRDGGLEAVWRAREFCQNAGDGLVVGFDHRHLRDIIDHLPAALQNQLRELDQRIGLNIRMRMGVAVGPVQRIDDERVDVSPNQPLIDACRICDARPTRMLLENSDERVTYLVVAVTPAVITSVIAPDPRWRRPSEFVQVRIDIGEKDYHTDAYVHVPAPSGDLLRFGLVNLPSSVESEQSDVEPLEEFMKRALNELPPTQAGGTVLRTGAETHYTQAGRDVYNVDGTNNTNNYGDGWASPRSAQGSRST